MRRLADHHHVVKLHASYVVGRELALILTPVADDGDLADFLHAYRDLSLSGTQPKSDRLVDSLASMQRTLENAYGCLAAGLAFMHEQTIRHKDIKPQNILVHRGSVLYTDFGISIDFSTLGHSTTTGRADSFTRRYCAPEVAEHQKRNSKSDVFSLGCVFLEITAAMYSKDLPESSLKGPFYERS